MKDIPDPGTCSRRLSRSTVVLAVQSKGQAFSSCVLILGCTAAANAAHSADHEPYVERNENNAKDPEWDASAGKFFVLQDGP